MKAVIKIEKGIPMPQPSKKQNPIRQALQSMEVGDSIILQNYGQVNRARYEAKKLQKKIASREENGVRRVWVV